ncbi:PREDICTED: pentatricopeptide repeat-containing protein At2g20540-like [Nelumbo nucifera]|uniref:Pentatricopeptide repeat-containing protein At2g20540-like n=1 Tax=Nelumbo nucifera TaxID=4432 RepID=A0A1U8BH84_NELNU|nr:PREDICTED: pentatricopeptide repeat-containing protein At2g20540-like [Nelumbo nucifera]
MVEASWLNLRNALARLLDECKNMKELKQIHSHIITSPGIPIHDHYFLVTRLLFFCATSHSGSLSYATNVFHHIEHPNVFVYNTMIRAHATRMINDGSDAHSCPSLILYKQMFRNGVRPDHLTFPFLAKECTRRLDAHAGKSIHVQVIKVGLSEDLFVQNSMINMYASCGFLNHARCIFDEMSARDVVSWNSMIIGFLRGGDLDSAFDLFKMMKKRNVITWNSIITGFVQGGRPKEALDFFHEMQVLDDDGTVRPDKITVASALSACASFGALDHGKWIHSYLKRSGLECDMVISSALVDMYGKCGCVERAIEVFKEMPEKDVLAWTTMISVLALHGFAEEAFDLFKEMQIQGTKPNHVTFVGLLSASAHSGLVEAGRWCFDVMTQVYSIEPQAQHYACMVDILSRAGLFEEAEGLIQSMPMEPDVFVWGALLGGCHMHGNVEMAESVAHHLFDLEPLNHAFYVTLSEIYAKANRFDDEKRIRAFMKERGIKKTVPGCSMIEVNGIVQEFSVGGSPQVLMEEIEWVLNGLCEEMKMGDHPPDINSGD